MQTCEVCQTVIESSNFQSHIQGKKHLAKANIIKSKQQAVERSVFVSRLPQSDSPNQILDFFSAFGNIKKHWTGMRCMILEFEKKETAQYLLSTPIYYKSIKLKIVPRIISEKPNKKNNKNTKQNINNTDELNCKNVTSIMKVDSAFEEQLTAFLDHVSISSHDIETRYEITCRELNKIFRQVFPKCKTYRFGSTITGLGFKNCDLDIYVDIGYPVTQETDVNKRFGAVSMSKVFADIKCVLYPKLNIFTNVTPIPRAKTPIIRFTYIPTNISCDISFKNSLAVYNSQLLKFYLSLDNRLQPTMMVLKYWVSNYELNAGYKMSKYALTLLFIFYCQQPSVKLVPPIIELKKKCEPVLIDGWQANFSVTQPLELEQNNISIPELLHGFFNFYAKYDFKSNVVCPIDGLSHNKLLLNEVDSLPESMDRYKDYLNKLKENAVVFPLTKPFCVQDPIELNHNVTGNLSQKYLELFQNYCASAAEICDYLARNNYKNLLSTLFSTQITEVKAPFNFYALKTYELGLPDDFDTRTDIKDKQAYKSENWFNLVQSLVQKYLEKVLKLEVKVEQKTKQQKIEMQCALQKVVMYCTGNYLLIDGRKEFEKDMDPSLSLLEKEIIITEKLFSLLESSKKLVELKTNFVCQLTKKKNDDFLTISLSYNNGKRKVLNQLEFDLKTKMKNVLYKTLLHMQQYKKKTIE